ncbi:MAG: hypothetical protein R3A51_18365 [Nannocystaceae bacterium]
MQPPARRPRRSFVAFVIMVAGVLLLMTAERPELRPRPDRPSPAAAAIRSTGYGLVGLSAAVLTHAALAYNRRVGRTSETAAVARVDDVHRATPPRDRAA